MKQLLNHCLILFLFLSMNNTQLQAQTFAEVITNANELLEKEKSISYDIAYLNYHQQKLLSKIDMHYERIDNEVFTLAESVKSYQLNDLNIVVHENEETILINKGEDIASSVLPERMKLLRELEEEASNSEMQEMPNTKVYRLFFKDFDFNQIEVEIDKETGFLNRLTFYLANPLENFEETEEKPTEVLEIRIENYKVGLEQFSVPLTEYFEKKEDNYYPLEKYANYQFINNYDWQ